MTTKTPERPRSATGEILLDSYPYELRRMIHERHENIGSSNYSDHKPTYQGELNRATESILTGYEKALVVLEQVPIEEQEKIAALAVQEREAVGQSTYDLNDFMEMKLLGQWVVARRFYLFTDRYFRMKKFFLGEEKK